MCRIPVPDITVYTRVRCRRICPPKVVWLLGRSSRRGGNATTCTRRKPQRSANEMCSLTKGAEKGARSRPGIGYGIRTEYWPPPGTRAHAGPSQTATGSAPLTPHGRPCVPRWYVVHVVRPRERFSELASGGGIRSARSSPRPPPSPPMPPPPSYVWRYGTRARGLMFAAKNEERGKGEKGAVVPGSVSGDPGARGRQTHPGGRRKINTRAADGKRLL